MIKEWFEKKLVEELNLPRVYSLQIFCILKETDKAVYAMLYTGFNNYGKATRKCKWIPKSAIENIEDIRIITDYDEAVYAFDFKYC